MATKAKAAAAAAAAATAAGAAAAPPMATKAKAAAAAGAGGAAVADAALGFRVAFGILLVVRLLGASLAPIQDCDETFNYLEPVHYLTRGFGMQTWEYSPEYALRSYAFVELYALPVRFALSILGLDPVRTFFFLRSCLGLVSAACEAAFCVAVARGVSLRSARLTLFFLAVAPGMFHAAVATLPSTLCMYAVLLGFAAWLRGSMTACLWCGSSAVLLGMPPAALLFVPHGMAALRPGALGLLGVFKVALGALLAFVVVPSFLDGWYYGQHPFVWTMGNHILYNVIGVGGGGAGADLYGTETWTFYIKNLFLNFNVMVLLALAVVPLLGFVCIGVFSLPRSSATGSYALQPTDRHRSPQEVLVQMVLPLLATVIMFTKLAHKEERFLTMTYPLVCFCAALSADISSTRLERVLVMSCCRGKRARLGRHIVTIGLVLVLSICSALSLSRIVALRVYFGAPLKLYERLYYDVAGRDGGFSGGVCVAKEWYRFPSSFFLPKSAETGGHSLPLLWLNSSFTGQLPRPFGEWPRGLSEVPPDMNDRNRREASRYSREEDCGFLVDVVLLNQEEPEPDPAVWSELACEAFLDADKSHFPWRTFWMPFGWSDRLNNYGKYCVWRRRPQPGSATTP